LNSRIPGPLQSGGSQSRPRPKSCACSPFTPPAPAPFSPSPSPKIHKPPTANTLHLNYTFSPPFPPDSLPTGFSSKKPTFHTSVSRMAPTTVTQTQDTQLEKQEFFSVTQRTEAHTSHMCSQSYREVAFTSPATHPPFHLQPFIQDIHPHSFIHGPGRERSLDAEEPELRSVAGARPCRRRGRGASIRLPLSSPASKLTHHT
jgi:hypothetical protein